MGWLLGGKVARANSVLGMKGPISTMSGDLAGEEHCQLEKGALGEGVSGCVRWRGKESPCGSR